MIPAVLVVFIVTGGIPRESGDDPTTFHPLFRLPGYSPRERG